MFCMLKKGKIYPAYVSRNNSNREKQVIPLMISNWEGWYNLAVKKKKKLSTSLREKTSKHHGDFNCLNCYHYFAM